MNWPGFLARLGRRIGKSPETPGLETNGPLAIVGDIHGCADLLERMLDRLAREAPNHHVVFLGDYVDRGPASRAVLSRLQALTTATCLMGNHESMMRSFLDDPLGEAPRWLRNGGRETLAAFGIDLAAEPDAEAVIAAAATLAAEIGEQGISWLRNLPLFFRSGNLVAVHAGPDPRLAPELDGEQNLLWGHPRFLREARADDDWIVHGHWVVDAPAVRDRRIAIDTGAVFHGRLSAALVDEAGHVRFVTVR